MGCCCLSQVPDLVVHEEEVYEDEDDENEEGNWRNDYPDEESDADSDREERYGGMPLCFYEGVSYSSLCTFVRKLVFNPILPKAT